LATEIKIMNIKKINANEQAIQCTEKQTYGQSLYVMRIRLTACCVFVSRL